MGVLKKDSEKVFAVYSEKGLKILSFQAFGTLCKVKFPLCDSINHEFVFKEIVYWVSSFERRYSRYLPDSWISMVNASAGSKPVELSSKDNHLIKAASFAFFQSNQAIDPSCLPLTLLWQKAKSQNQVPKEAEIKKAKALVNWQLVQISEDEIYLPIEGMGLDFGGFGKEYAVDKVSSLLVDLSVENFLVDFGGDIFAAGHAAEECSWKVGIEIPEGNERPAFVVNLTNRGLATSGNYRKFFDLNGKRYGHTIDHRTGYPTIHSELSASLISSSCLKSGIASTACLMSGKQHALRMINSEWDLEGCLQSFDSPLLSNKFHTYLHNEGFH